MTLPFIPQRITVPHHVCLQQKISSAFQGLLFVLIMFSLFGLPAATNAHSTCAVTTVGGVLDCLTSRATLHATGAPAAISYSWTGPGIVSGANTASVIVNRSGTYTVTTEDAAGCVSSAIAIATEWFAPGYGLVLPDGPVDFKVFGSDEFYFDLLVLNAPAGSTVTNGFYAAWCVKYDFPIETNQVYRGTLHFPFGADLPVHMQLFDWPRINYIINHKGNASAEDIQTAIWFFSGKPEGQPLLLNGVAQSLVDAANANGQCYVPSPCDPFAVALDTGGTSAIQWLILEVMLPAIPAISVTKVCGPSPAVPGGMQTFTGTVTNTGTVTLTNVFVYDDQPVANTLILGPITLAPGTGVSFSGGYSVPGTTNISTNTVTGYTTNILSVITTNETILLVTNISSFFTTNNISVLSTNFVPVYTTNTAGTVVTNTTVTITTNATSATFGTINPVTEGVVDRFSVPPNLNGLTYADEDKGYAATQFYSTRRDASGDTFFETITAGTAAVTDRFDASTRNFDSLTFAAPDVGYGPVIFYSLSHNMAGASTFGTITPGGVVGVVENRFPVGNNFDSITFAATDVGYGANLFYYVRHDSTGLSTFGTIDPALPGVITDRFNVGSNVHALVFTSTDPGAGYGANNFYYLRKTAGNVSTFGTIRVTGLTTATVTDRFNVGQHVHELTFTPTDTAFGPNLFYFLREGVSFTTNTVTTFTTNNTQTVTTNQTPVVTTNTTAVVTTTFSTNIISDVVRVFTTNSVPVTTTNTYTVFTTNNVPALTTDTVTASGMDLCQGRTVVSSATCTGWELFIPHIGGVGVPPFTYANGVFTLSFATQAGVRYKVQYKTSIGEAWTDLPGMHLLGTGANITVSDSPNLGGNRFYQVVLDQ